METEKGKNSRVLLFHNAFVVTMDSDFRVFRNGAVVVAGERIIEIGQSPDILGKFSHSADEIMDLAGRFLLPGSEDGQRTTAARCQIKPSQKKVYRRAHNQPKQISAEIKDRAHLQPKQIHECCNSNNNVTCFAEAGGQHVAGMARAVKLLGLRGCLTQSTMDSGQGLPDNWSVLTTDQCIQSQIELYKKHHNTEDGRIKVWFGLRQIMNCTDRLLIGTKEMAQSLNTGIHMHVAEISYENDVVMETRQINHGTVTYLEKIGLLGRNLLAAHSVWVNETEIGFLAKADVKVSHCPAAAMRMLGFAPIKEMLDMCVCVSLGTDGAPSNNRMSIDEMFLASLVNKGREAYTRGATNPTALPAEVILKMATINGAKSVLWDDEIGSIEIGKKADMIIINPFLWSMLPLHDSISNLVYCMRTENIESVMCNGQWILKNKKISNLNEEEVYSMARKASSQLLKRAGIILPSRFNCI